MRTLISIILLLFTINIIGQKAVLLKKANGQQLAFYGNQPFIDAYAAAGNEDTIYLPGGTFSTVDINKRLAIYGAGHYPDSTNATDKTIIYEAFRISSNADSLLLTYAANALLVNNIFEGTVSSAKNGDLFRNNIFITASYPISGCTYGVFENNIFKYSSDPGFLQNGGNSYNTLSYNVFTCSPVWWLNPNNNNYINADPLTVFINQTGYFFDYSHNYHLQSPGIFLGTDGTQCGIYGGQFGYKEGGIPVNPHIRQKTIANTTDVNGNLNVNITVAAQNN